VNDRILLTLSLIQESLPGFFFGSRAQPELGMWDVGVYPEES
jgi:hypothetical protein